MTTKNTELLFEAARDGNAEDIQRLIPISDPKNNDSMALQVAASYGHTECVKLLIPVSDPKANNSAALAWAAQYGNTEALKVLIAVSDPKANDSVALRQAVLHGHPECVDALYGVSDVHAALQHFQHNNMGYYAVWRHFEQRVEAERQHSVLSKEVGDSAPIRKSKM